MKQIIANLKKEHEKEVALLNRKHLYELKRTKDQYDEKVHNLEDEKSHLELQIKKMKEG